MASQGKFTGRRNFKAFNFSHTCGAAASYLVGPIVGAGRLVDVQTVIDGAITTADEVCTVTHNGESVGTVTITQSGSAAGDVDTLGLSEDRYLSDGDYLKLAFDNASGGTALVATTVVIELDGAE